MSDPIVFRKNGDVVHLSPVHRLDTTRSYSFHHEGGQFIRFVMNAGEPLRVETSPEVDEASRAFVEHLAEKFNKTYP